MTHSEFSHIQDHILGLSGRDLAAKLGVPPSSISNWRKSPEEGGREVPEYIAILLGHLQALHFSLVKVPLTVAEILDLSALATRRGVGFAEMLLSLIRDALRSTSHSSTTPAGGLYAHTPETRLVAEDPTPYKAAQTPPIT